MPTNQKHPTVAVFFNHPGKLDYPFDNPMYYESYRDFTEFCHQQGINLVIVRDAASYLGNMQFSRGWRFVGTELEELPAPVTADLIYNKELEHDLATNPGDRVLNDPEFDRIGRDKWLTAQAFPTLVPTTYKIDSMNWHEVINSIPTRKVVLKPISGTEGRGIYVLTKEEVDFPSLNLDVPYIAQAFVDSTRGIPGLCEGMHDLRIIVFNGKPTLAFLRLPKPGSVLSNLAQGGSAKVVDIADVPQQILDGVNTIDAYYRSYPHRIYTADFFMEGDRAYLVETNTRPGFPHPSFHGPDFTQTFYRSLVGVFHEALSNQANK